MHSITMVYLCSWTVDRGGAQSCNCAPETAQFKTTKIEDDLHKRIARAVHDKMIKSFYMRESSRDGDQDLTMSMREVEEVVSGSMGDSGIKGHQHYTTNSRQSLTMQTGNGCGGAMQSLPSR